MRRRVIPVLLAAAVFACRQKEPEPSVAQRNVTCAPVQSAQIRDDIQVRGTLVPLPDRQAQVAPQVSGRVLAVEVREGDAVTSGQIVARIDDAPLTDAAQEADAALERARAENGNAKTTLARLQHVFDRGIVAKQEVDDAAARDASTKAAQKENEASVRTAHRQIERAVVRSPLTGVVLAVLKKPGELVDGTAATPVVEIADISALELTADVPVQDLVLLKKGLAASVSFPGVSSGVFAGTVSRVSPGVDRSTGMGSVRILLTHATIPVPPVGTFGVARIETGEPHAAILVPLVALRSVLGTSGEVVVCGADKVAHVKKVSPKLVQGDLVEITGELAATDQVAIDPVLGLNDGDRIAVSP